MTGQPPPPFPGLQFSDREALEAASEGRLLSMDVELSRRCNLKCIYCYSEANGGSGARPGAEPELSTDEIVRLVDQAVDLGARVVVIVGGGEPLLHPGYFRIVDRVRRRGILSITFTNGTLLTPEIARRLAGEKVNLCVKVTSLDPAVQDRLAGSPPGTGEKVLRAIDTLLDAGYASNGGPLLGVESIVCRENARDIPDLYRWIRRMGFLPYVESLTDQGRAKGRSLALSAAEYGAIFEGLARMDAEEFGIRYPLLPPIVGHQCRRWYHNCYVTASGDVLPCAGVEVPGGNVRHEGLASILARSPVFRMARRVRESLKGKCRDCRRSETCYGCRGAAFQATGDFLAADPLCWYE